MTVFDEWAKWAIMATSVPQTVFVLAYGLRRQTRDSWFRSAIGRALMFKALALAIILDLAVAFYIFGDSWLGRDYVRAFVYSLMFVGSTYQCYALLRTQATRDAGDPMADHR